MGFAIAAAGTGGHVYPGIAVAEQLLEAGVDRRHILFLGGDRMEAEVIPGEDYEFVRLELQGLVRSLSPRNLRLPRVVWRAAKVAERELAARSVRSVLCMGGYVTVPVAVAARRLGIHLVLHEQNVEAGLANRLVGRWADTCFVSFPETRGLAGTVVGYPLRAELARLDKTAARSAALRRYGFEEGRAIVGVVGGSQGSVAINQAVSRMAAAWTGQPIDMIHLAGPGRRREVEVGEDSPLVNRVVRGFENRMDLFYSACDAVIGRAGGGLMEAAVTGTPGILIPGSFGGSHQRANATAMAEVGGAILLSEAEVDSLGRRLRSMLENETRLERMGRAAMGIARPDAAATVAKAMLESFHAESG